MHFPFYELPPELQAEVISHLPALSYKPTLLTLSITSRLLRALSLPALFESLNFSSHANKYAPKPRKSPHHLLPLETFPWSFASSVKRVSIIIEGRKVTWHNGGWDQGETEEMTDRHVVGFLWNYLEQFWTCYHHSVVERGRCALEELLFECRNAAAFEEDASMLEQQFRCLRLIGTVPSAERLTIRLTLTNLGPRQLMLPCTLRCFLSAKKLYLVTDLVNPQVLETGFSSFNNLETLCVHYWQDYVRDEYFPPFLNPVVPSSVSSFGLYAPFQQPSRPLETCISIFLPIAENLKALALLNIHLRFPSAEWAKASNIAFPNLQMLFLHRCALDVGTAHLFEHSPISHLNYIPRRDQTITSTEENFLEHVKDFVCSRRWKQLKVFDCSLEEFAEHKAWWTARGIVISAFRRFYTHADDDV
ncbi:hypothetical protein BT69DRAFT_441730 [Atractiella rhizophila]|nr:hypothetical protein BT69DRAFT_441730 [Atractiella rhizophila]